MGVTQDQPFLDQNHQDWGRWTDVFMIAMSGSQWYVLTEKVCAVDDWPLARSHPSIGLAETTGK